MVMAGGLGERMRASGIPAPKPLVRVSGCTLLELNLRALIAQGFDDIVVAAPASIPAIGAAVEDDLRDRLRGRATVALFTETEPLGNIGAAGTQRGRDADLLVIFADNLSALDLRDLIRDHRGSGAALTLASHAHPFPIPYGELVLDGREVTAYREKPTIPVTVASAYSVLSPAAQAAIPPDRPTGMVDLTRALLAAGAPVRAYPHDADWVDVNDADKLSRAAEIVAAHPRLFAPPGSQDESAERR